MEIPTKTIEGVTLSRLNPATEKHLEKIIEKYNIKKVLEVGSYLGMGSTKIFAKNCEEVHCIENFSTNLKFNLDINNEIMSFNQFDLFNLAVKGKPNIKIFNKDSKNAYKQINDNYYDLVFIDGSHYYPDVMLDIKNYYYKLKKNGILMGDDCQGYLKDFDTSFIIDNLDNHNTVNIENFKYSQIHPGVIMAVNDLIRSIIFENKKIMDGEKDLGYSWLWKYKRSFFNDIKFELNKSKIKKKLIKGNDFREKYLNIDDWQ